MCLPACISSRRLLLLRLCHLRISRSVDEDAEVSTRVVFRPLGLVPFSVLAGSGWSFPIHIIASVTPSLIKLHGPGPSILSSDIQLSPSLLPSHPLHSSHKLQIVLPHLFLCIITSAYTYKCNMSSPSRRNSDIPRTDDGPPPSLLQQLLEEINGHKNPLISSRQIHTRTDTPKTVTHTSSVWCRGGKIAQDARAKLRAMDEARQRKISTSSLDSIPDDPAPSPLRRYSTQLGPKFYATRTSIWKPEISGTCEYASRRCLGDALLYS
jgi:hypothetical protein